MGPLSTPPPNANHELTPPKTSSPGHWLANHDNLAKRVKTYISPIPPKEPQSVSETTGPAQSGSIDATPIPQFDFSPIESSSGKPLVYSPAPNTILASPGPTSSLEELIQGNFGVSARGEDNRTSPAKHEEALNTGGHEQLVQEDVRKGGSSPVNAQDLSQLSERSNEDCMDRNNAQDSAVSVASDITVPNTFDSLFKDNMESVLPQDTLIHAGLLSGTIVLPSSLASIEEISVIETREPATNLVHGKRTAKAGSLQGASETVLELDQDQETTPDMAQELDQCGTLHPAIVVAPDSQPCSSADQSTLNSLVQTSESERLLGEIVLEDVPDDPQHQKFETVEAAPIVQFATPVREPASKVRPMLKTEPRPRPGLHQKLRLQHIQQLAPISEPRKTRRTELSSQVPGQNQSADRGSDLLAEATRPESTPPLEPFKTPAKTPRQSRANPLYVPEDSNDDVEHASARPNVARSPRKGQSTPHTKSSSKSSARRSSQRFTNIPVPTPQPTPTKSTTRKVKDGKVIVHDADAVNVSPAAGRSSRSRREDAPASRPKDVQSPTTSPAGRQSHTDLAGALHMFQTTPEKTPSREPASSAKIFANQPLRKSPVVKDVSFGVKDTTNITLGISPAIAGTAVGMRPTTPVLAKISSKTPRHSRNREMSVEPVETDTQISPAPKLSTPEPKTGDDSTLDHASLEAGPRTGRSKRSRSIDPVEEAPPSKRNMRARAAEPVKADLLLEKSKTTTERGPNKRVRGQSVEVKETAAPITDQPKRTTRARLAATSPEASRLPSRKVKSRTEAVAAETPAVSMEEGIPATGSVPIAKGKRVAKQSEAPQATATRASKRKKADDETHSVAASSPQGNKRTRTAISKATSAKTKVPQPTAPQAKSSRTRSASREPKQGEGAVKVAATRSTRTASREPKKKEEKVTATRSTRSRK